MLIIKTLDNVFDFLASTPSINQGKIIYPSVDDVRGIHSNAQTILGFIRENMNDQLRADWEITLDLSSAVFKKHFPDKSKEYFFFAADIFRDLRSFTTDIDLLSECLEEFDHTTKKAVTLFWEYIEKKGIVDEDEYYRRMTERFLHENARCDKETVAFIGFQHMTAHQVDLIKALSINHNVYLLLDQYQCDNAQDTDWVNWFDVTRKEKTNQLGKKLQVKVLTYPKNRPAEYIHHFLQGRKKTHVVLAQKNPDFNHCNEIAVSGASFRYREDIFTPIIDEIFEEITLRTSLHGSALEPSFIEEFLEKKLTKELSKKGEKNFRLIKILSFLQELMDKWKNVSQKNDKITDLDIAIFKKVALICLPKTYAQKIVEAPNAFIFGIDKVPIKSDAEINILVASSNYNAFEQDFYRYNPKSINILSAIGPIRKKEFEILFFKKQIINFLQRKNAILFIEEGLFEENLFWGEIEQTIEISSLSFQQKKRVRPKDFLSQKNKKYNANTYYSASKLQTYIDCPRRFYYTYIERLSPNFQVLNELGPAQLGILEHEIIKEFFEKRGPLDKVVTRILDSFILNNSMSISESNYLLYREAIKQNADKGISFVKHLKKVFEISQYFFEHPIEDGQFKGGRADFVAYSPKGVILIDFKRSPQGVPSRVDIVERREIQILYYFSHLEIPIDNSACVGFYCLSEPKKSYLISKYPEIDLGQDIHAKKFNKNIEDAFKNYPTWEGDLVEEIQQDRDFKASPRDTAICNYCHLRTICPRGTLQ